MGRANAGRLHIAAVGRRKAAPGAALTAEKVRGGSGGEPTFCGLCQSEARL